jgi:hypothetical protein
MYKSGIGVSADHNKAVELISSARESGLPLAAVALSSMTDPVMTKSVDEVRDGPSASPNAGAQ